MRIGGKRLGSQVCSGYFPEMKVRIAKQIQQPGNGRLELTSKSAASGHLPADKDLSSSALANE